MFAVVEHDTAHTAFAAAFHNVEIGDLRAEAILAAQILDGLADALDDGDEAKGADVRLGDVQDLVRRAGLDEFRQHFAAVVVRILDLAIELAVRERAGAALAELDVRLGVKYRAAPQAPG